jgi:hypothetical protein
MCNSLIYYFGRRPEIERVQEKIYRLLQTPRHGDTSLRASFGLAGSATDYNTFAERITPDYPYK